MTESSEREVVEYTPFQEKLMAIVKEEYGKRNVIIDGNEIVIHNEGRIVTVSMGNGFAVFYSTLTTKDGRIFTIPKDEISDYMEILTDLSWFQPALYRTVSKVNYVPHYVMCLYSEDINDEANVSMLVENLCSMTRYSSRLLNESMDRLRKDLGIADEEADILPEELDVIDDESEDSGESQ